MPTVAVFNIKGNLVGELDLNDKVFNAKILKDAMHRVAIMQMANLRQGTVSTKTRSEVRGGGRKPWRQKGTGRARHGSIRSPIWVGGGITFGPKPRNYSYTVPKKLKRVAIKSALTAKVRDGELLVVEKLEMEKPKTKEMIKILQNLKVSRKILLVIANLDANIFKSAHNIPKIKTILARQLNVLDILNHDFIVITRDAVAEVEEVFGG